MVNLALLSVVLNLLLCEFKFEFGTGKHTQTSTVAKGTPQTVTLFDIPDEGENAYPEGNINTVAIENISPVDTIGGSTVYVFDYTTTYTITTFNSVYTSTQSGYPGLCQHVSADHRHLH